MAWIDKPAIIGLSPMDGITDPAFRFVVDTIGKPEVLFTEFVSADGLSRNVKTLFRTFISHQTGTPLVAQLFGKNPDALAKAAILLRDYPISGIDINMGCPMRTVAFHGGGAGLIKTPKLAVSCIQAVKEALAGADWNIPVSVKTRTGIDKPITAQWIQTLITAKPDAIILHGRTLAQMYTGHADWSQIGIAAALCNTAGIPLFGNGDIKTIADARDKISFYRLRGVLIGRAAFGNPWVFCGVTPTAKDRFNALSMHLRAFETYMPDGNPLSLRKHCAWYTHGLANAKELRIAMMKLSTVSEMKEFVNTQLSLLR